VIEASHVIAFIIALSATKPRIIRKNFAGAADRVSHRPCQRRRD